MKLIIFYFACIAFVYGKLGSDPPCHRSDPNVVQCLYNKFEKIQPNARARFAVGDIYADTSISGAKMSASLSNVVAYLASQLQVTHLSLNLQNKDQYYGEIRVLLPTLYVKADYYFKGIKMFILPIDTYGEFIGKFDNVALVIKCTASPHVMNGVEYLQVNSVSTSVSIGTGQLYLEQADWTFTGMQIASYARLYPDDSLEKLTPAIEYHAARLFMELSNDILSKVPLQYILV